MWRIGKEPFLNLLGLVVVVGSNPMDPKTIFLKHATSTDDWVPRGCP
jgi:hypothetical protein